MEALLTIAAALVVFDIMAVRFGKDSRDLRRPATWW
jgi:hypothetical protein